MLIKFVVNKMPEHWYECPFNTNGRCEFNHIVCNCTYFSDIPDPEFCNWLTVMKNED